MHSHSRDFFESNYISDHSQATIVLHQNILKKPKPLKFLNSWCLDDGFLQLVRDSWSTKINGCSMFILVSKLNLLKAKLKFWHRARLTHLHSRISSVETQLACIATVTQLPNAQDIVFAHEKHLLRELLLYKAAYYSDLQ